MKEKVNQIKGQYTEAAMAGGVSQSLGSQMNPFMSIRELTVSGLLAGITIFLGLTGYGFIPLIFMNATILHIPTIIGSVVAGPRVGIVVGFLFGAFSFIQTLRAPSLLMQFILQYSVVYDAFICIVPRICIALVSYWLYKHIQRFYKDRNCCGLRIAHKYSAFPWLHFYSCGSALCRGS